VTSRCVPAAKLPQSVTDAAAAAAGRGSALLRPVTKPVEMMSELLARPGALSRVGGGAAIGAAQSAVEPRRANDDQTTMTLLAAGGGGVGGALQPLASKLISPFATSTKGGVAAPERARLAELLLERDVPVSASQYSGSPLLASLEKGLVSVPMVAPLLTANTPAQRQAASRAVARAMGESGESPLTREVLDAAHTRLGRQFDVVRSVGPAAPDSELLADVSRAIDAANKHAAMTGHRPRCRRTRCAGGAAHQPQRRHQRRRLCGCPEQFHQERGNGRTQWR
jgi:hypothetical protein